MSTYIDLGENGSAPSTPDAGRIRLWAANDAVLHIKDDAGNDTLITGGGDMLNNENLSGLTNVATARTNLGLGTIAVINSPVPVVNGGTGAINAADARTSLGCGSIATQNSNNVSITGGSVTGITDLAVADGGTGASTPSGARSNLGIGLSTRITTSTLLNDWVGTISYWKDILGMCYVEMAVSRGNDPTGNNVFQLPSGYNGHSPGGPADRHTLFPVMNTDGGFNIISNCYVQISSTGMIIVNADTATLGTVANFSYKPV